VSEKNKHNNKIDETISKILNYPYAIILGFAFIVYFQTIFFDFINFDDDYFVQPGPEVQEKLTNVDKALSGRYMFSSYYRPVVNLSFLVDTVLGKGKPLSFHLTNLILHCLTSCLVFLLFRRLKYEKSTSLIIAIIFTVHPILINAEVWVVGRNDILPALFGILSFIFFIGYMEKRKPVNLILHGVSFFLAVFSKEMAFLFPLVFGFYWYLIDKKSIPAIDKTILICTWLLIILLLQIIKIALEISFTSPYFSISNLFINYRTVLETIAKIIFPFNIHPLPSFSLLKTLAGLIILLSAFIYIYIKRHRLNFKRILFGFLWFLLFIFPGLFIHMEESQNEYLDCRVYLPIIGIFIVLIELLPEKIWNLRKKINLIIFLTILTVFSVITYSQSKVYKDPIKFWEYAVESNPDKAMFHRRLGINYAQIHGQYDKGIEYAKKALEIDPKDANSFIDLGYYYTVKGNLSYAIKMTKKAIEIEPNLTVGYEDLFINYYQLKKYDSAAYYAAEYQKRGGQIDPEVMRLLRKYIQP